MPVKRTLAKRRAGTITAEAVAAYQVGDSIALHRALGLSPWEASPIGCEGPSPYTGNSGGANSWEKAKALRAELDAAAAEQSNKGDDK